EGRVRSRSCRSRRFISAGQSWDAGRALRNAISIEPTINRMKGTAVAQISPDVLKEFAPSGTLRAAINQGNTVLAQTGPNGEALGITVDLARELARRLGVPIELITFDAAGKVFDALKRGIWDIAFLAVEPVRAAAI